MMTYLLQVFLFQLAFLLVYEIWLKKETFFNYNRWYLILAPSLAFLLPLLKLDFLSEALPAENLKNLGNINVWLPEVMIGNGNTSIAETTSPISETSASVNWWLIFYASGALLSLILLTFKFRKLQQLTAKSEIKLEQGLRIHSIPNSDIACTFFNKIFIGDQISAKEKQQIMAHELVHIRENHSLDLLFFEILKVVFWFNPLVYVFQNQLATVHEYIADQTAVKISGKKEYYHQLLNTAFSTQNISFINQFFNHSLIKKRILMLQKNNSSKLSKFKFLLVIPLMLVMLTYVACSDDSSSITEPEVIVEQENSQPLSIENELVQFLDELNSKNQLTPDQEETYLKLLEKRERQLIKEEYGDDREIIEVVETKNNSDAGQDVPFAVVDQVPVFPGCENLGSNEEQKKCMSEKISQFVNSNFDTSLGKKLGLTGTNRVIVQFRIDENGNIQDARARAPHPDLEEEAKRTINSLPQMEPGKQKGRDISVMYSLPIAFKVAG